MFSIRVINNRWLVAHHAAACEQKVGRRQYDQPTDFHARIACSDWTALNKAVLCKQWIVLVTLRQVNEHALTDWAQVLLVKRPMMADRLAGLQNTACEQHRTISAYARKIDYGERKTQVQKKPAKTISFDSIALIKAKIHKAIHSVQTHKRQRAASEHTRAQCMLGQPFSSVLLKRHYWELDLRQK